MKIFADMINQFMADFIKGFLESVKTATFSLPNDIFATNGVADKFNDSKHISQTFSIICLTVCMLGILFSLDISSSAKLKLKLNEFLLSIFVITFGQFFINRFNLLSNLFVDLWLPNNIGGEGLAGLIMAAIGVGATTGALQAVGFFLLCLLGLVALLLLLMMLTHSILLGLLQVVVIVFPLIMAFYPLSFGKKMVGSIIALYGVLLTLGPIQALVLNLFTSSLQQASEVTFQNLMNALGYLIITVLIIPGALIYVIARSSNPKLS